VLLLVACAGFLVWWRFQFADAWMPNVATTALGLAGTITIVEWIIRREAAERHKPRTLRILYSMGLDIRLFAESLLLDYAGTHRTGYRPIPATLPEMIDQWQADHDEEDVAREHMTHGHRQGPLIVHAALELADNLTDLRDRNLDVLEPDLVGAIEDFQWAAAQASWGVYLGLELNYSADEQAATDRVHAATIVRTFKTFTVTYFRYGDHGWRQIMDLSRRANQEHHDRIWRDR
jgi:hypothetical protein